MAEPVSNPETLTILQYAIGLGTTIGAALAAFFGVRSKIGRRGDARRPAQDGAGLEIYIDGPLIQALNELKKITTAVEHMAISSQSIAALREEFGTKLSKSKHDAFDKMHEHVIHFEKEFAALETRLREAERLAAVLNERVGSMQDRVARRT